MKILVLFILFFTSALYTNAEGTAFPVKLIVDKEVIVSTVDSGADTYDIFESALYNSEDAVLEFLSCKKISLIRIFDKKGQLEFQLPVMSTSVKLSKSLFGQGEYMLGFIVDGMEDVHLTHVNFL
jgi:hypothetical protein